MNRLFDPLNRPDVIAAAMLGAVGLAGLWFGQALPFGMASAMDAGYLPLTISWILVGMAVAFAFRAAMRGSEANAPFDLRPAMILVAATILFGLLLQRIGLAATVAVVTVVATYAGEPIAMRRRLALAAALSVACVLVFVTLLGQPIAVWWWNA